MPRIKVSVVNFGREELMLRWIDPYTRKRRHCKSGTSDPKKAEKIAARKEIELEKKYTHDDTIGWDRFVELYLDEGISGAAETSIDRASWCLSLVTELIGPSSPSDIDRNALDRFVVALRKRKTRRGKITAEATVNSVLATIKASLMWAKQRKVISEVPQFPFSKRASRSLPEEPLRGRAITDAEFDLICGKAESVDGIGPAHAGEWKRSLRGLFLSGLRIKEACDLWWNRQDKMHIEEFDGHFYLAVLDSAEKGKKNRLLPVTPDFEEFLRALPHRDGLVFRFPLDRFKGDNPHKDTVSDKIAEMGRLANVVVDDRHGKTATAQDFRRTFGERWAWKPGVTPQILMTLMRHQNIRTTMRFYVRRNAMQIADTLRDIVAAERGNKTDNTRN